MSESESALDLRGSARSLGRAISPSAFFAVLMWSAIAPFSKYALTDFPALAFMALRMSIAAAVTFLILAASRRPLGIERIDARRFLIAGGGFFGMSTLLFTAGLSRSSVAHMVIIGSTSPLIGAVYRWVAQGEQPDRRSMIGMLVGFVGVLVVVSDASASEGSSVVGDLMGLASAALWVGMTIYPQPLVKKYGAMRATGWIVCAALLLIVPLSIPFLGTLVTATPPPLAWAAVLYAAMGTLFGNTLWQHAVQQVGPARTLIYLYLQPFLALLIAAIVLGDRVTPVQMIGGALAIGGVMLVKKG